MSAGVAMGGGRALSEKKQVFYAIALTITVEPTIGGDFVACVSDLPGCFEWGKTEDEAIAKAKSAALKSVADHGLLVGPKDREAEAAVLATIEGFSRMIGLSSKLRLDKPGNRKARR